MSQPEYEHRVVKRFPTGVPVEMNMPAEAEAGQTYRAVAKRLLPGENVEIQRREVGPWEVVRTTRPEGAKP